MYYRACVLCQWWCRDFFFLSFIVQEKEEGLYCESCSPKNRRFIRSKLLTVYHHDVVFFIIDCSCFINIIFKPMHAKIVFR